MKTLFFEFLWVCFLSAKPHRPQSLIWLFQMGQKKHDNEIKKYENCFFNQDARFGTEPWQRVRGGKHLQRIRREMSSSCCPWLILTCTKKHWLPSCQCLHSQPCVSQLNSKLVTASCMAQGLSTDGFTFTQIHFKYLFGFNGFWSSWRFFFFNQTSIEIVEDRWNL